LTEFALQRLPGRTGVDAEQLMRSVVAVFLSGTFLTLAACNVVAKRGHAPAPEASEKVGESEARRIVDDFTNAMRLLASVTDPAEGKVSEGGGEPGPFELTRMATEDVGGGSFSISGTGKEGFVYVLESAGGFRILNGKGRVRLHLEGKIAKGAAALVPTKLDFELVTTSGSERFTIARDSAVGSERGYAVNFDLNELNRFVGAVTRIKKIDRVYELNGAIDVRVDDQNLEIAGRGLRWLAVTRYLAVTEIIVVAKRAGGRLEDFHFKADLHEKTGKKVGSIRSRLQGTLGTSAVEFDVIYD